MKKNNISFLLSPYAIPVLMLTGLFFYFFIESGYYQWKILFGGAKKYESFSSYSVFLLMLAVYVMGMYLGSRIGLGKIGLRPIANERDFLVLKRTSAFFVFVSAATLLLVQLRNGTLWANLSVGNITEFKDVIIEGSGVFELLALTFRHLIYLWAACINFEKEGVNKIEILILLFLGLMIGLFTESRLMIATLAVVLIVNYYRSRRLHNRTIILFAVLILSFLALGTLFRIFSLNAEFSFDTFEVLFLETVRYFITPFGYSLALIDLSSVNFRYGLEVVFGFFLLSLGKFLGLNDAGLAASISEPISLYYYPSLNQVGSFGQLVFGFGVVGSLWVLLGMGFFMGYMYKLYRSNRGLGAIVYSIFFAVSLDMVRFLSVFAGPFPTCVTFAIAVLLLRRLVIQRA